MTVLKIENDRMELNMNALSDAVMKAASAVVCGHNPDTRDWPENEKRALAMYLAWLDN